MAGILPILQYPSDWKPEPPVVNYSVYNGTVTEQYLEYMHWMEDEYGLPRGTIAAISVWESSGGIHRCGYNITGYASCGVTFSSFEEGIEVTASTLSGYSAVDLMGKLCIWVSGSPEPCSYGTKVIATMERYK